MKTIDIWTEGEVVLIKAKVEKIHIEKDRESYELTDMSGEKFKHRFTKKDIYCLPSGENQVVAGKGEHAYEDEDEDDGK